MYFLLYVLTFPLFAYWRSYVATIMWGWFITPAYGWNSPSIYTMTGILLAWTLTKTIGAADSHTKESSAEAFGRSLAIAFFMPTICLGFGWIWKTLAWGM